MLNKAILMGRLTADPELRHTQNNTPVTSFTLAVNRSYGKNEQTDFIDVVAWQRTAEFVSQWFHKGMLGALAVDDAAAVEQVPHQHQQEHDKDLGDDGLGGIQHIRSLLWVDWGNTPPFILI